MFVPCLCSNHIRVVISDDSGVLDRMWCEVQAVGVVLFSLNSVPYKTRYMYLAHKGPADVGWWELGWAGPWCVAKGKGERKARGRERRKECNWTQQEVGDTSCRTLL